MLKNLRSIILMGTFLCVSLGLYAQEEGSIGKFLQDNAEYSELLTLAQKSSIWDNDELALVDSAFAKTFLAFKNGALDDFIAVAPFYSSVEDIPANAADMIVKSLILKKGVYTAAHLDTMDITDLTVNVKETQPMFDKFGYPAIKISEDTIGVASRNDRNFIGNASILQTDIDVGKSVVHVISEHYSDLAAMNGSIEPGKSFRADFVYSLLGWSNRAKEGINSINGSGAFSGTIAWDGTFFIPSDNLVLDAYDQYGFTEEYMNREVVGCNWKGEPQPGAAYFSYPGRCVITEEDYDHMMDFWNTVIVDSLKDGGLTDGKYVNENGDTVIIDGSTVSVGKFKANILTSITFYDGGTNSEKTLTIIDNVLYQLTEENSIAKFLMDNADYSELLSLAKKSSIWNPAGEKLGLIDSSYAQTFLAFKNGALDDFISMAPFYNTVEDIPDYAADMIVKSLVLKKGVYTAAHLDTMDITDLTVNVKETQPLFDKFGYPAIKVSTNAIGVASRNDRNFIENASILQTDIDVGKSVVHVISEHYSDLAAMNGNIEPGKSYRADIVYSLLGWSNRAKEGINSINGSSAFSGTIAWDGTFFIPSDSLVLDAYDQYGFTEEYMTREVVGCNWKGEPQPGAVYFSYPGRCVITEEDYDHMMDFWNTVIVDSLKAGGLTDGKYVNANGDTVTIAGSTVSLNGFSANIVKSITFYDGGTNSEKTITIVDDVLYQLTEEGSIAAWLDDNNDMYGDLQKLVQKSSMLQPFMNNEYTNTFFAVPDGSFDSILTASPNYESLNDVTSGAANNIVQSLIFRKEMALPYAAFDTMDITDLSVNVKMTRPKWDGFGYPAIKTSLDSIGVASRGDRNFLSNAKFVDKDIQAGNAYIHTLTAHYADFSEMNGNVEPNKAFRADRVMDILGFTTRAKEGLNALNGASAFSGTAAWSGTLFMPANEIILNTYDDLGFDEEYMNHEVVGCNWKGEPVPGATYFSYNGRCAITEEDYDFMQYLWGMHIIPDFNGTSLTDGDYTSTAGETLNLSGNTITVNDSTANIVGKISFYDGGSGEHKAIYFIDDMIDFSNQAPVSAGTVEDISLEKGFEEHQLSISDSWFTDPDNDDLEYHIALDSVIAEFAVTNNETITFSEIELEDTLIATAVMLTAYDNKGGSASHTFSLEIKEGEVSNIINVSHNDYQIYPNPLTTGKLSIVLSNGDLIQSLKIIDVSGKVVYTEEPGLSKVTVNRSELTKSGLYLINISTNTQKQVTMLLLVK